MEIMRGVDIGVALRVARKYEANAGDEGVP